MVINDVFGLVFPNVHDDLLSEMTEKCSMGSLPFAGRYRLIDFTLSNLVNAGVSRVGIITKSSYQSLMNHIGNGKAWDLDRKRGGVVFLPPFSYNDTSAAYNGLIDGLFGVMDYIKRRSEKYVVLCESDVVTNFDLAAMIKKHIESGADVTACYKHGKLPANHNDTMVFSHDGERITDITFPSDNECCDFSLNIMVMSTELLIKFVNEGKQLGMLRIGEIFRQYLDEYKFCCYETENYAAVIDSVNTYICAMNDIINNSEVRHQLFNNERPIFTKTHDDMPTKYGFHSDVKNSIIADGCIIMGTVRNCVLFRGVKIAEGTLVENCILMTDCEIGKNAILRHVILDRNETVAEGKTICGTESNPTYIKKSTVV